jgi:aminoglycoside 3-N-acetyltransferase
MTELLTRQRLASDLRALGIAEGEVVLVHSSLKQVGQIEPDPRALVEAFMDVLGGDGTLVVPTLVPALRGIRPRFNVRESPSEMGLLTETVRTWPGAQRSDHPTHSVAALGRQAEALTARHGRAWGPNSPWGRKALGFDTPWDRLREANAWVLLAGVDFSRCTLLHHAQARYLAQHEGVTAKTPWPEFDFRAMGERLEAEGIVRRGKLGSAECRLARAGDIVTTALRLLEQEPDAWLGRRPEGASWLRTYTQVQQTGRPRAAAFKTDITPPWYSGTVARPIHARGVLLEHPSGERAALVVVDDGGFYHGEGAVIRRALAEASGIPQASILLSTTHDHSAIAHHRAAEDRYIAHLASRVAEAGGEAAGRLEPVRAGWTVVPAPGINRSRTVYLRDGRAYTERWLIPSTWHVKPEAILRRGPADEDLRLLVLERLDGTRVAVAGDLSCHAMSGMHETRLHDDFLGVAMEVVETAEGNGCVALCTPGSEGDQNPMGLVQLGDDLLLDHVLRLGKRLGGYILAGSQGVTMHDVFALATATEQREALVREDWQAAGRASPHPELQRYAADGKAPAEVTALAIGDYALVGIPCEFFTDPAMNIREHAPFPIVSVTALVNGKLMYVAEREAFFEESTIYAVEPDFPAVMQPGTDRILTEAALAALRGAKRTQAAQVSEART